MKLLFSTLVVYLQVLNFANAGSTLSVTCPDEKHCADEAVKELKEKYKCDVAGSGFDIGGQYTHALSISGCDVKIADKSASNLCPAGTKSVGVAGGGLLKICTKSQGTESGSKSSSGAQ